MKLLQTAASLLVLLFGTFTTSAQTKWYKFSKGFIDGHYPKDSAIGQLQAKTVAPAKNVHTISCGGNDGELHIGIEGADVLGPGADGQPFSSPADGSSSDFGVVAEPVNLAPSTQESLGAVLLALTGVVTHMWNVVLLVLGKICKGRLPGRGFTQRSQS